MSTRFEHLLPALGRLADNRESVSLAQVADDACLSPGRAQRVFLREVGESPKQFSLRVRLQRAAALLLGTPARIVDVAVATGFEDHETFTRAFRRYFGVAPSAYRATNPDWVGPDPIRHAATTAPCVGLYRKPLTNNVQETSMTNHSIERHTLEETPVLFGRRKLAKEEIAAGLAEVLPAAFGHAMSNGLEMVGPPFVRYADQSAAYFTIEAGVPLASAAPEPDEDTGLTTGSLPGGEVAFTAHVGPYETLGEAHVALDVWMNENGVTATGAPWEVYITDPAEVPDPAEWITHVYQPI